MKKENTTELSAEDLAFLAKHSEAELEAMEDLEKGGSCKCVRCGKPVGTKGGRCKACLAKLKRAKHTPGSAQRAATKADDALRRQKGKNGTAHKKSKGLGTRASIERQVERAEKKTGQKLSPDRVKNSSGYASKNTRMVPEKLNRGRHHVDPKKLATWKKRLKKAVPDMSANELITLVLAKAQETDPELFELLLKVLEDK